MTLTQMLYRFDELGHAAALGLKIGMDIDHLVAEMNEIAHKIKNDRKEIEEFWSDPKMINFIEHLTSGKA